MYSNTLIQGLTHYSAKHWANYCMRSIKKALENHRPCISSKEKAALGTAPIGLLPIKQAHGGRIHRVKNLEELKLLWLTKGQT